ncbi:MAG: hypothetical protein RR712_00840 [Terrisporobacter sp.]|uniref:hypothetical protein n=1 Tax=Terrisporobacter sp. TaxID=1965305 RepID=UPI002FC905C6
MNSKLAMIIYIIFAVLSFIFGIKMFSAGETLRGILFMVAVACWGMCIYNNSTTNKRQEKRLGRNSSNKSNNKKSKAKR